MTSRLPAGQSLSCPAATQRLCCPASRSFHQPSPVRPTPAPGSQDRDPDLQLSALSSELQPSPVFLHKRIHIRVWCIVKYIYLQVNREQRAVFTWTNTSWTYQSGFIPEITTWSEITPSASFHLCNKGFCDKFTLMFKENQLYSCSCITRGATGRRSGKSLRHVSVFSTAAETKTHLHIVPNFRRSQNIFFISG